MEQAANAEKATRAQQELEAARLEVPLLFSTGPPMAPYCLPQVNFYDTHALLGLGYPETAQGTHFHTRRDVC